MGHYGSGAARLEGDGIGKVFFEGIELKGWTFHDDCGGSDTGDMTGESGEHYIWNGGGDVLVEYHDKYLTIKY